MQKLTKITLMTALLVGSAYATETRVNVLTQNSIRFGYANYLMDDEYIIQFYPSALFRFPAHFSIEVPAIGSNTIIYGNYAYASAFAKYDNYGFGAYLGRDRLNVDIDGDNSSDFQITPLDLLGGINLNNLSLGLNLRFGTYSFDDKQNPATTINASLIGFNPSISFNFGENGAFNIGIPLQFASATHKTGDTTNVEYSDNRFGFLGRIYNGPIIGYALYISETQSWNNPPAAPNPDLKISTNVFGGGLGLNLPISDIGFGIAGLNINSISSTTTVGNTSTTTSSFSIGLLIGGEIKLWRDNLKFRSSFTYDLLSLAETDEKESGIGNVGNLTLGFGYEVGFIRFDGAVSTDLLYNGPYFLTGNSSSFIPSISILGKF